MKNNTQLEQDILIYIADTINEYEDTDVSELHHNLFNSDYWTIGYYEAEQEILRYGSAFKAIAKIQEYEQFNFGECTTDVTNSESVCNMLAYILGEEALQSLDSYNVSYDGKVDSEFIEAIKQEIENLI